MGVETACAFRAEPGGRGFLHPTRPAAGRALCSGEHASAARSLRCAGLAWCFSTHTQRRALPLQKAQPWAWMGFSQCKKCLHEKVNNPRVHCAR